MTKNVKLFALVISISICVSQNSNERKHTVLLSVFKQHTLYSLSYEYLFNSDYSYDIGVFPIRINGNIFPNTTIAIKRHFTDKKKYHIGFGATLYESGVLFQLLFGLKSSAHLPFRMQLEIGIGLGGNYDYTFYKSSGSLRILPSLGIGYAF